MGNGDLPKTGGWETARDDFRGSICVYGPHDLVTLPWGDLWTPQAVDALQAREQASPIRHVHAGMKPLLIFHADNDHSVPIDNPLAMIEVLRARNAPHEFHHSPDAGHMLITPEVIDKSLAFIRAVSATPLEPAR